MSDPRSRFPARVLRVLPRTNSESRILTMLSRPRRCLAPRRSLPHSIRVLQPRLQHALVVSNSEQEHFPYPRSRFPARVLRVLPRTNREWILTMLPRPRRCLAPRRSLPHSIRVLQPRLQHALVVSNSEQEHFLY